MASFGITILDIGIGMFSLALVIFVLFIFIHHHKSPFNKIIVNNPDVKTPASK